MSGFEEKEPEESEEGGTGTQEEGTEEERGEEEEERVGDLLGSFEGTHTSQPIQPDPPRNATRPYGSTRYGSTGYGSMGVSSHSQEKTGEEEGRS